MASNFLDDFPKIKYDPLNRKVGQQYETVTNLFFRVAYLRDILKNIASYHVYELQSMDTPERIAENVYGDAGANWMIIYANQILDPQWDWPLNYHQFTHYVADKYRSRANVATISELSIVAGGSGYANNGYIHFEGGSGGQANCRVVTDTNGVITYLDYDVEGVNYIDGETVYANVAHLGGAGANIKVVVSATDRAVVGWTQGHVHHYEKVLTRIDNETGQETVWTFEVDEARLTEDRPDVPYEYYTIYALPNSVLIDSTEATVDDTIPPPDASDSGFDDGLPLTQEVYTFTDTGKTVTEIVNKRIVYIYDYEEARNEQKRTIKVIKRDYYNQIMSEFSNLAGNPPSYLRALPATPEAYVKGLT